jgi:hypothetical protein
MVNLELLQSAVDDVFTESGIADVSWEGGRDDAGVDGLCNGCGGEVRDRDVAASLTGEEESRFEAYAAASAYYFGDFSAEGLGWCGLPFQGVWNSD